MLGIPFDFAKPVDLIKYLISLVGDTKHDIVMDFFSGSATTAHAVMQLNEEDNGHRKFIMIQWPEETNEKSEKEQSKDVTNSNKQIIKKEEQRYY